MHVYGWLCTLYDGLSWLCEQPPVVMSTLDLVEWVYAQGNYCRCIFMLYYMHNHHGVIVSIHVTSDIGFPIYATRINMFDILRGFGSSYHEHVGTHRIHKRETLPMRHSASNAKLCRIFALKMGHLHCRILIAKAC